MSDFETLQKSYEAARTDLKKFFAANKLSFDQVLVAKSFYSPQKFSRYFQKEVALALGHTPEREFALYDAYDQNQSQEYKYATMDEKRGASFPQMLRFDVQPDKYVISIFFEDEVRAYDVPGKELHNSIIAQKATRAHANNKNQRRINIRNNSPELAFLEKFYSPTLMARIEKHQYSPIK